MKSILVVEDSSMTRAMIKSSLEDFEMDIDIIEASTGFEALKRLPSQNFDLIITDINMPDINGLELINFIRKDTRFTSIPLLIVSTEKSEEDKRRGLAIGANAYLTKPFNPDDLQQKVKSLLGI